MQATRYKYSSSYSILMPKNEIRIMGIDDAPFDKFSKGKKNHKNTTAIAVLFRGGQFMDGILSTKIRVDGSNSTKKLIEMVNKSKFRSQLKCILLDGIALGGFNVIDIQKLSEQTGIPVIAVMRHYPDIKTIHATLKKLGMAKKIRLLEKAGTIHEVQNIGEKGRTGKIYAQLAGISIEDATKIIKISCTHSFVPEPIRVAHLIGQGLVFGESRGRA
jgi:uncharacterized protein